MIHQMRLDDSPFERIKNGNKKYEIRLLDEKRKGICLGDEIIFSKRSNLGDKLGVRVVNLSNFSTFSELYDRLNERLFPNSDKKTFVQGCYQIYPKEKENKYSVLAIEFEHLEMINNTIDGKI